MIPPMPSLTERGTTTPQSILCGEVNRDSADRNSLSSGITDNTHQSYELDNSLSQMGDSIINSVENESEVNSVSTLLSEESNMTTEQKKRYMINLYQTVSPTQYNNETLSTVATIVRTDIVRKVKFIGIEHTNGLSREAVEETRRYPSFWRPDVTEEISLQHDIFKEFPDLQNGSIRSRVKAWMGMREKVRLVIRSHRNTVQTAIQQNIVEGMLHWLS